MHEPVDLRPSWIPRTQRRLGLVACLAAIGASGIVSVIALRPAKAPVIRVAAPATQTTVMPLAVPSVVVITAPAPVTPPAPAPEPEAPISIAPRALVPTINPACVTGDDGDGTCTWDAGLPAISADGTTIAIRDVPDDGGRGYPGLSIQLVDAKTSRITKSIQVLSPDEYLEPEDAKWPKLRAKIAKRAAIAQKALDAGQFRSLVAIDGRDLLSESGSEGETTSATDPSLRYERAGEAIRLIDRATNTVVWQRRYPVEAAFPPAKNPSPDGEGCYPSTTRGIGLAWDPQTRTLFAGVSYASGPCYCGDEIAYYVMKI